MFGKLLSVFAATVAVASAYTQPVGEPNGNPIYKPGLNELVPAGSPYTITWTPTTQDTVTLLLLRGPSNNVVPLYPIVEGIANTGTYDWTPSLDLQPDTTGYGIQLICDDTGAYQYSTQFGISNDNYSGSNSSSSAAYPSSTVASNTTMTTQTSSEVTVLSTGMPANSSVIQPTSAMTVPSTLGSEPTTTAATATTSQGAVSTGAAGRLGMSLGGAVAALAVAVAAF